MEMPGGFLRGMPGGRRFPEEGDAHRIPERNAQRTEIPSGWRFPEEGEARKERMPGGRRFLRGRRCPGRRCLEEDDAQRMRMERQAEEWIHPTPNRRRHTSASPRALRRSRRPWKKPIRCRVEVENHL